MSFATSPPLLILKLRWWFREVLELSSRSWSRNHHKNPQKNFYFNTHQNIPSYFSFKDDDSDRFLDEFSINLSGSCFKLHVSLSHFKAMNQYIWKGWTIFEMYLITQPFQRRNFSFCVSWYGITFLNSKFLNQNAYNFWTSVTMIISKKL